MFNNIEGFEVLGEDIFVYKNFVLHENISLFMNDIYSIEEKEWSTSPKMGNKPSSTRKILNPLIDNINSFLNEGYFINKPNSFVRMFKGDCMIEHFDANVSMQTRKESKLLKENNKFSWKEDKKYGVVVYFNEFEGGEIYYPYQNIEYKPSPGDLVIHSAEEHCLHGVRPVKSNIRYSMSSHIYNMIKVPA